MYIIFLNIKIKKSVKKIRTLSYGFDNRDTFEQLKKVLKIKYSIHSIPKTPKNLDLMDLILKVNVKPKFSKEAQKLYLRFYKENFDAFNIMIISRGINFTNHHEIRNHFAIYFYFFYEIITQNKINLIIFSNLPHQGPDFIIYKLAQILRIKTILCYQTIFRNKFFVIKSLEEFGYFKKKKLNYNKEKIDTRQYTNYFKAISKNEIMKNDIFHDLKTNVNLRQIFRKIAIKSKIIKRVNYEKIYKDNLQKSKISNNKLNSILDSKRKIIFVALNFQPELTTSILGLDYEDQILMLEKLNGILKKSHTIIVKDHPLQTSFQRGEYFFERLKYLNNIYLVDNNIDSGFLIDNADVVCTVSGTIGWEALLKNKKCLVFGKGWYHKLHGCKKVNNEDNENDLKKFIYSKFQKKKFESDFNSLISNAFDGVIDEYYKPFISKFNSKENAKNIGIQFKNYIKRLNV